MKLTFTPLRGCLATLALGAILMGTDASAVQFNSPLGSWDCVMSGGGQAGLAVITFGTNQDSYGNFSLTGYELLASLPITASSATNPRGAGGVGRTNGNSNSSTNAASGSTNIFGFVPSVQGPWNYDSAGRVIGYFFFPVAIPAGSTNFVTNAISFVGTVVPKKRLTIIASTSFGKVVYSGVPFVTLTNNLSGSWNGLKVVQNQPFQEFFALTPSGTPNLYWVNGGGPGYIYNNGYCLLSAQKQLGFTMLEMTSATNGLLRASVGPFISNKAITTARTKGVIQPDSPLSFNATKY